MVVWPWLAARASPTQPLTPPPQKTGGKDKLKKLTGQDIDKEITYQLPPWAQPSFSVTHQVHPDPWEKTIPWMGLPFPKAGITQEVFPNMFLSCTTGTLSPSTVCKRSDWAGPAQLIHPLALTNQVARAKWVSQFPRVPPPIAFRVAFNNPLYRSIFPEAGAW